MIRILAADVVNRIAAGEVVERPASVVKELVENSLDAGAASVAVEFAAGGVERVEVADDGCGLDDREALLALENHATSKVASESDLLDVSTYGFRGEALPSIASVSRLTLLTRPHDAEAGTRVYVEGGRVVESAPAGVPPGTRVRVEDLFYNTPARLKFLKTERTETSRLVRVVKEMSLSRPQVGFSLHRDGVETFACPSGQERGDRVRAVMGHLSLFGFEHEVGEVRIEGLLTAPQQSRAGAGGLVLVINGRVVVDRSLAGAVAAAYEGLLARGRYPQGAVFVELPPRQVDVNVHPQKREVRFSSARRVTGALHRAVSLWARKTPWQPSRPAPAPARRTPPADRGREPFPSWDRVGERQAPLLDDRPPGPGSEDRPQEGGALHARPAGTTGRRFSVLSIVGRALGTYLVCEDGEKIVLVDQHAAAERVTFEKLRGQYRRGRVQRQLLLVPVRCDLDETLVDAVEQNEGLLQAFGIQADPAGPDVVTVREVPVLLGDVDPRRLLSDVLAELTDASGRIEAIADEVLAAMACHVSVRAGDDLDIVEARGLLDELDRVEWSTHCPHGRPVSCEITAAELERRIGRR